MHDDALPGRRLALAPAALALLLALVVSTALLMLHQRRVPPGGVPVARPAPPPEGEPALQTAPQDDLLVYKRTQAAALARAGATHVPLAAAVDRLVAASGATPAAGASGPFGASANEARP